MIQHRVKVAKSTLLLVLPLTIITKCSNLDVAADPPLNELLVWDYKDSNTQLARSLVVSDLR